MMISAMGVNLATVNIMNLIYGGSLPQVPDPDILPAHLH